MSRENVETVRRVYEAAARRDSETVLALYDPEIEIDGTRLALGGLLGEPRRRGHEGLRSFFRDLNEAWDNLGYDVEELIDAGGDHVVSVVTRRGHGAISGLEAEISVAVLWTLRDGKVVRLVWFASREQALHAVLSG